MTRRSLSGLQREKIFLRNGGVCHLCERRIRAGEPWDVSHDRPLELLGEDGGDNLKVAHRECHKDQTKLDVARIAKARRQSAKHLGIKKPSSFPKPPAGSRWDWKLGRRVFEKEA